MAQFTINKSALSAVEGQLKASRSDIVSSLTHIINVANSCAAINIFAPPIYLAGVQEDDEPIKDYREDGRKYIKYAKNIASNARDLSNIKNDLTAVINDVENILNAIDDFESQSMSLNGVTQRANSSLGVMVLGSGLGSTSVAEEVGVAITDLVTDESGLLNLDSSLEKGDDSGTFNVIGRLLGDTSLEDINGNLASEFVSSLPELEDTLDAGGVGSLLTGGASLLGIDNSDGDAREGVLSSMITLAGGLLAPVGEGIEEITSEVTEVVNSVGNKNPDDAAEDKTKTKNAVGVLRNFNRPAQAGDNNGAADQRVVDEPVITEEEPEVVLNNSMVEDSPQESQLEETPQQEESQPNEGLDRASAGLTQNMANHRSSNNSRDDNQGQGEGVPVLEESIPEEAPVEEQHSAPQENNDNPEPTNTNAKENNNSNNSNNSNNNPENVLDGAQKVTPGDNSNGNKNVLDNVNNVTNDKDGSKVAGAGVAAMTAGVGSVIGKNVDIPVNPVTPSIGDIPSVSNVDVPNATPATVSNNETATEFINNLNDVSGNNTGNPVYDNNKFADNFEQNNQNIVDNNTINNVNNINDINSLNNQNDINSQNNLNTQNNNVNNGQQNNNVTNRVNNSSNDAKRDVSNDFGKSKKIYSDGETQGTENNPSTEQELKNDNGSDKVDELQEKGIKEKKELEQGEGVISGSSGYIKEPSKTEFIVATGSTVGSVIVAAILKVLEFINFFAFILLIIAIILLFTTYCSFRKKRVKTYKHQMNKMNRNSTNNNGVNSLNTKNSNNSINNGLQPLTGNGVVSNNTMTNNVMGSNTMINNQSMNSQMIGNGVVSNQVVNNQKTNNTMMNSQNMNSSNTNMNNQQSMGVNQVNNMQSTTREMVNKNEFGSGNGGLQNNNINMQSNRTNENSKSDLIIPPMKDSPNYEEFGTGLDFVNNSSNK